MSSYEHYGKAFFASIHVPVDQDIDRWLAGVAPGISGDRHFQYAPVTGASVVHD